GDGGYGGDITVTGNVTGHPGYNTLSLQTQQGSINTAAGATLTAADLALQAGTGIGTTGAMAIAAANLAFASQSGTIHLSNAGAVTLTSVYRLQASSIPADVFSAPKVGDVYTLLHSSGGVSGQITYQGQALPEGATLTLADGHRYRISYRGNGGQDVTLTRVKPAPRPGAALVGRTLVITGGAGRDVVRLARHGSALRVYASFLPAGGPFLTLPPAAARGGRPPLRARHRAAAVARAP